MILGKQSGVVEVFSIAHILIIIGLIGIIYASKYLAKYVIKKDKDKIYRYTLAFVMIGLEVAFNIWSLVNKGLNKDLLPFELCSVVMWVIVVALFLDNKKMIKIVTPWGIIGALLAFVFFDMGGDYPFYHFRFFHFFGLHMLFVVSSLYYFFSGKITEYNNQDIKTSIFWVIGYSLFILVFNYAFDFNYLFLKRLPKAAEFVHKFIKPPFHAIPYFALMTCLIYLIGKGLNKLTPPESLLQ